MNNSEVIELYSQHFFKGKTFTSIVEARRYAQTILGRKIEPGTALSKQIEECIEAGLVRAAKKIAEKDAPPQQVYAELLNLYQRQPSLSTRSSTSVLQQAYSTPIPIAYLAGTLAGITAQTSVYEPTAGHGALLLRANPALVTANEINPDRCLDLRTQGYQVTQQDALSYLPSQLYDVAIANPPFGSVTNKLGKIQRFHLGEYSTTQIDHVIALQALKAMKPEGKAVLILGGKLGNDLTQRSDRYNTLSSRGFYFSLYNQYKVTLHISIKGELYRKQGAGFPIDLILIEGKGKSNLPLPAASVPKIYESFEALGELLNDFLLSQPQLLESTHIGTDFGSSSSSANKGIERRTLSETIEPKSELVDSTMAPGARSNPRRNSKNANSIYEQPRTKWEPSSDPTNGYLEGRMEPNFSTVRRDPNQLIVSVDKLSRTSHARPRGEGVDFIAIPRNRGRGRHPPELGGMADRTNLSFERNLAMTEQQDQVKQQVPYIPKSQGTPVNTLLPVNMRSAVERSLKRLEQQVGSIDSYVANRLGYASPEELHKYFSAEQVDACALAIANLEKKSAFIIGDQTGIGKGRVVAATIRYAKLTGRTPIFVTKDPTLYADMIRDLSDINMTNFQPFVTNPDLKQLPLPDGRVLKTSPKSHQQIMTDLLRSKNLGDYDGIFTTYAQLQSVRGKETSRRDLLRAFAPSALLILDESHEAGGSKDLDNSRNASNRAEFVRELVQLADGVFYSSATYAKRPDVMDLYSKTDMRLALKNMNNLTWMVQQGGIPMQQALATMLADAGQYLRRERSFEGVKFDPAVVPVNREVAEDISRVMAGVLAFDRLKRQAVRDLDKELKSNAKAVLGDGAIGVAGASSVNFTSIMHNLLDQMLLALKAEVTVQKSLELLRQAEPEKPVIALSSTMGSFIEQYAELNDLKPGDEINLDFGELLRRYLNRSREVLLGDPFGKKTHHRLTDEELGAEGVAEYQAVMDSIDATDFSSIPISPIDYIRFRLNQEGFRVNEITGRKHIIEYAAFGETFYQRRSDSSRSKATSIAQVRAFNEGQLDAIVLNRSGSTGISLHASERFSDRRRRHMIVVQPERDINQFMQMLGRVHRTGQVVPPNFTLLMADIPAEKRPGAVLAKKMASLNANTTAARQSGINLENVPDFMNEYGDLVAAEVMQNYPELHAKLDYPLQGGDELDSHDAIRKVSGRIPLLPLVDQELIYELIEQEYKELVERQQAMGESILEAQTLDLDARIISRTEVISAFFEETNSPFTAPVYLEEIDAKTLNKPVTTIQAVNLVRTNLGLGEVKLLSEHDFDDLLEHSQKINQETIANLSTLIEEYRQKQLSRLKNSSAKERFNEQLDKGRSRVEGILETFPIGVPLRLVTPESNIFYGVTLKVWQTKQDNPVLSSSWRMQILLCDRSLDLVIPFSRINTNKENSIQLEPKEQDWAGNNIYQSFDLKQTEEREQRQVFTGNLLRAFEQFPTGKFVNFTDSQGRVRQGVLTPKDFDLEKALEKQPIIMPGVEPAYQFLLQGGQLKTLDKVLTLDSSKDGLFFLSTPKSKQIAGRYYLDSDLISAAMTDFYSVEERMESRVSSEEIKEVLKILIEQKAWQLAAFDKQALAREILNIKLPVFERNLYPEVNSPVCLEPPVITTSQTDKTTMLNSSAWDTLSEESLENIIDASLIPTPTTPAPPSPIFTLNQFQDILDNLKTQIIEDEKLINCLKTASESRQFLEKEIQKAVDSITLAILNPKTSPLTERHYLNFYKAWQTPENSFSKQQWTDLIFQELSGKIQIQQQAEKIAAIAYHYLKNYLDKESHHGVHHNVSFASDSHLLTLKDNAGETKLLASFSSEGKWQIHKFNLTEKDIDHFQKVDETIRQRQEPNRQIQASRVERVADILLKYLNSRGQSQILSVYHNIFWEPQNRILTLEDKQAQKIILKAQKGENNWKDLGSCLNEQKEKYFQQTLLPNLQAEKTKQMIQSQPSQRILD